jgi:hypothetical protein
MAAIVPVWLCFGAVTGGLFTIQGHSSLATWMKRIGFKQNEIWSARNRFNLA